MFFYSIGNHRKLLKTAPPSSSTKVRTSYDTAATISGDSPLFYNTKFSDKDGIECIDTAQKNCYNEESHLPIYYYQRT